MELRYYCGCNLYLLGCFCLAVLLTSCSPPQQIAQIPAEDLPQILREVSRPQSVDTTKSRKKMTLRYHNKSTSVTIPIDPHKQEFILEMSGLDIQKQGDTDSANSKDSTIQKKDSVDQKDASQKIKQVLRDFRRAQDLFYRQDYQGALEKVNSSLATQQTADALGLKGTIFFIRDNISSAKYYWNKAVRMDPEIPVPDIPELESLIQEIKVTKDQREAR